MGVLYEPRAEGGPAKHASKVRPRGRLPEACNAPRSYTPAGEASLPSKSELTPSRAANRRRRKRGLGSQTSSPSISLIVSRTSLQRSGQFVLSMSNVSTLQVPAATATGNSSSAGKSATCSARTSAKGRSCVVENQGAQCGSSPSSSESRTRTVFDPSVRKTTTRSLS
eukprot:scaffold41457_cov57-Phaeocystis_antarctica.AAC.2